jgi:hypothetical protein
MLYVEYTILILFCFVTGWGEQKNAHGWLCTGEDMSGTSQNFIFYEIVRTASFIVLQHHTFARSSPFNTFALFNHFVHHQANACKLSQHDKEWNKWTCKLVERSDYCKDFKFVLHSKYSRKCENNSICGHK